MELGIVGPTGCKECFATCMQLEGFVKGAVVMVPVSITNLATEHFISFPTVTTNGGQCVLVMYTHHEPHELMKLPKLPVVNH